MHFRVRLLLLSRVRMTLLLRWRHFSVTAVRMGSTMFDGEGVAGVWLFTVVKSILCTAWTGETYTECHFVRVSGLDRSPPICTPVPAGERRFGSAHDDVAAPFCCERRRGRGAKKICRC